MTEETQSTEKPNNFPVVGIGASAGGLEAFEKFFTYMPSTSGMAFVLIQHLDPTHDSILDTLIQRYTDMPVFQVKDIMLVKPDTIYIIPPNRDMALLHGELHLLQPKEQRNVRLPIDYFFRSLADDQHEKAIGIVLSGTGSDGTLGLKAIKGFGGMTMAEDPESAKYAGMPQSAIATGMVDFVLRPDQMPETLINYVERAILPVVNGENSVMKSAGDLVRKIFILLRSQTGHDFSMYKSNTIERRIERRMAVNQLDTLENYVHYLQQNPLERELLFKELLIGVTNFFRDPEAFHELEQVIQEIVERNVHNDEAIRVWVAGCSTGEEAYGIAMMFQDVMERTGQFSNLQIFATDIDKDAIEQARAGLYPDNIIADVPKGYLNRFFHQENSHYRVNKNIRGKVVFAEQSIIKDPPFSRLHLISCRNLLIYLEADLQKNVISMFHYALKPGGYLFLGTSETLRDASDLFLVINKRWKIFQSQVLEHGHNPSLELTHLSPRIPRLHRSNFTGYVSVRDLAEKYLLDRYAFPSVLINEVGDILYFFGDTSEYLKPAVGEASLNVLRMAHSDLLLPLTNSLQKIVGQGSEIIAENLTVRHSDGNKQINLIMMPIESNSASQRIFMIIFELIQPVVEREQVNADEENQVDQQRVKILEQELQSTRRYLQSTIEELETSNEELKSTNEEFQSSNEQLQSTNEELETVKEELQSVNEELVTVNSELNSKIDQLSKALNDQVNLLNSINVGIIFLDMKLNIRLFNPVATQLINVVDADIGRPIWHFASNFDYPTLLQDVEKVQDTLKPISAVILAEREHWYLMHIRPYRTKHGEIDGVVITFMNITEQIETRENLIAMKSDEDSK